MKRASDKSQQIHMVTQVHINMQYILLTFDSTYLSRFLFEVLCVF